MRKFASLLAVIMLMTGFVQALEVNIDDVHDGLKLGEVASFQEIYENSISSFGHYSLKNRRKLWRVNRAPHINAPIKLAFSFLCLPSAAMDKNGVVLKEDPNWFPAAFKSREDWLEYCKELNGEESSEGSEASPEAPEPPCAEAKIHWDPNDLW